jgi:hypothetical protein
MLLQHDHCPQPSQSDGVTVGTLLHAAPWVGMHAWVWGYIGTFDLTCVHGCAGACSIFGLSCTSQSAERLFGLSCTTRTYNDLHHDIGLVNSLSRIATACVRMHASAPQANHCTRLQCCHAATPAARCRLIATCSLPASQPNPYHIASRGRMHMLQR